MGILSLIPIKDWIYGAIIVAVSIFGAVEWHKHNVAEQALGATKVLASDKKTADVAGKQVAAGTATATTTETSNAETYDHTPAIKPIPSLVCRHTDVPRGSGVVPEASTGQASGTDQPATDGGSGSAFDPVPALLARAHAADAQIVYLQGRILELETQMKNSP